MKKSSFPGKKIILIIIVIVALGGVLYYSRQKKSTQGGTNKNNNTQSSENPQTRTWYYHSDNSYSFEMPSSFGYDDVSLPGVNLIFPAGAEISTASEEKLYGTGAISIAPDRIYNGNNELFRKYVENEVPSGLTKNKYTFTSSQEKIQGYDAQKFVISNPYGLTQYYINTPTVLVLTAHQNDSSTNFVLSSLQQAPQTLSSGDRETVTRMNKMVLNALQKQLLSDIYRFANQEIKDKVTEEKFISSLSDESSKLKDYNATFDGYTITNLGVVVFQSKFTSQDKKSHGAVIVALEKKGDSWEIAGVTLQPITETK